jgi:hypothetical protein
LIAQTYGLPEKPARWLSGLVASLARPGGNVTGFSALSTELITKRLEILNDAVPKLARVGLLRPAALASDLQLKDLRPAAQTLKLKLEEIDAQPDPQGLESAFQTAKQKQVNAIMTMTTRAFFAERKRIVELAAKYRLPAIYFQREFVDEGGLMSYGADFDDLYRRAAVYVDKILKGAKPGDLPVQQATKFEFVINLKAAKQIGLTIPGRVLERANKVIRWRKMATHMNLEDFAKRIQDACLEAVLQAYEDAGVQGLCDEGRWEAEAAVGALRTLDLAPLLREFQHRSADWSSHVAHRWIVRQDMRPPSARSFRIYELL